MRIIKLLISAMVLAMGVLSFKALDGGRPPVDEAGSGGLPLAGACTDPFLDGRCPSKLPQAGGASASRPASREDQPVGLLSSAADLVEAAVDLGSALADFAYGLMHMVHSNLPPELRCLEGLGVAVILGLAAVGWFTVKAGNRLAGRL